jgi:hypothetical protein
VRACAVQGVHARELGLRGSVAGLGQIGRMGWDGEMGWVGLRQQRSGGPNRPDGPRRERRWLSAARGRWRAGRGGRVGCGGLGPHSRQRPLFFCSLLFLSKIGNTYLEAQIKSEKYK